MADTPQDQDGQGNSTTPSPSTSTPSPVQVSDDGTLTFQGETYVPKRRFDGLQGPMQKKEQENQRLNAKVNQITEEYESKLTDVTAQLEQLQNGSSQYTQQIEALTGEKTTLEQQIAALNNEKTVNDLLLSQKYIPLIAKKEKGLLRIEGLEGEALTEYLDGELEFIQELQQQGSQQFRSGESPDSTPGEPANMTFEQLSDKVMAMSSADADYDKWMARWEAEAAKPQKSN